MLLRIVCKYCTMWCTSLPDAHFIFYCTKQKCTNVLVSIENAAARGRVRRINKNTAESFYTRNCKTSSLVYFDGTVLHDRHVTPHQFGVRTSEWTLPAVSHNPLLLVRHYLPLAEGKSTRRHFCELWPMPLSTSAYKKQAERCFLSRFSPDVSILLSVSRFMVLLRDISTGTKAFLLYRPIDQLSCRRISCCSGL